MNRREFLKLSGLALGSFLITPPVLRGVGQILDSGAENGNTVRPEGMKMGVYFEMIDRSEFKPAFNAIETVGCNTFDKYVTKCTDGVPHSKLDTKYTLYEMKDKINVSITASAESDRTTVRMVTPFFDETRMVPPEMVLVANIQGSQGDSKVDKNIAVSQDGKGGLYYRVYRRR